MAKKWSNKTTDMEQLYERTKNTVRTTETVAEYQKMKRAAKEQAKDRGGFVGGHLKNGRRLKQNVVYRSMLTPDLDHAEVDFIDRYEMLSPYESILYTTHGHTPEAPRLRLMIPFSRNVTPDEYVAIARYFAAEWGIDQFDPCSYQVHQLMFWPTTPADGEYICKHTEGECLDPDAFLAKYPHWQDCSLLPTCKGESEVRTSEIQKAEDPLLKDNMVGVFCRCYSVTEAIDAFLSDIYCPSDLIPGRYQYIPADSKAGVEILDDGKFLRSHHATDPAFELNLNAFDLVRIHKFPAEDDKKSFNAMCEFAQSLDPVKLEIAKEREESLGMDFGDEDDEWKTKLRYMPRSKVLENSVWNEMLILNHDPDFANFAFNELAGRVQLTGAVPWSRPEDNKFWRDADTAQMKALIDMKYVTFSSRNHDVAFTKTADDRRFHPVRDYLDELPKWDGVKRVEEILIRCLEADDTPYVRAVTRKTFAAAVARIYHPGIKFDSVLVFDGVQGIGKSTLFKDLVGEEFYSETLSLTDMNDKSGAEKLQGFWIIEIAELAGMKKADIEKVKAFLSTSDDKYRPSYGKTVESHPRQCVIIASVNGERGYLRDITGNRRFWIVKLRQTSPKKDWNIREQRDQIWAEAKEIWAAGEKLYLEGSLMSLAAEAQKSAMEEDERKGLVEEYLNTLLPENWDSMDLYQRRNFLSEKDAPTSVKGTVERTCVSNLEIWCECFGRPVADLKPSDSYTIAALMTQVDGWVRTEKIKKLVNYGRQRLYVRTDDKSE